MLGLFVACLAAFTMGLARAEGHGAAAADPNAPAFYAMEPLVVNLAQPDSKHYVQVSIAYQVANSGVAEQLKVYSPIIRSRAILVLSSKTKGEISNLQGRQRLMDELVDLARLSLPRTAAGANKTNGIDDVHFTGFVIQ